MGATGSRSSPTDKTTHLLRITEYSKLVREPLLPPRTLITTIVFRNTVWDVTVGSRQSNEGLADYINVLVYLAPQWRCIRDLDLKGFHISLEILDETGKNIVFLKESNVSTLEDHKCLILCVHRRELEASSCVHNDSFTVRCTLSKQQAKMWCLFSQPKKLAVLEPQVAMAGSHMLTIGSFSMLKAALRNREGTYSTYFVVAGYRWCFKFCPAGEICLFPAIEDRPPITVQFSFELEGVVNFVSEKMTHTFDDSCANSSYLYRCRLEPSMSAMHDRLIVRCRLAVMMVEEKPSLPPIASSPITNTQSTESMLTPLLSAMYE